MLTLVYYCTLHKALSFSHVAFVTSFKNVRVQLGEGELSA